MSIYEKFNSESDLRDFPVSDGEVLYFPSLSTSGEPVFGFKLSNGNFYYIKSGTTFIPSVDAEGNLSWNNEDGKKNPETVNIRGEDGKPAGFGVPTFTVKTLEPDEKATVNIIATGKDTEKVFNFEFGIPRGKDANLVYNGPFKIIINKDLSIINIIGGVVSINGEFYKINGDIITYENQVGYVFLRVSFDDINEPDTTINYGFEIKSNLPAKEDYNGNGYFILGEILPGGEILQYYHSVPVMIIGEECEE